jgi:hypothetical protein
VTTCVLSERAEASDLEAGPESESARQMVIVEKYEQVVNYLYPIFQNTPRKHGVARDMMLRTLFLQVELFIVAGKSRQVSRLYAADANLATLRYWLRFAVDPKRKIITSHQHRHALSLIAEIGKMIGSWVKAVKSRG